MARLGATDKTDGGLFARITGINLTRKALVRRITNLSREKRDEGYFVSFVDGETRAEFLSKVSSFDVTEILFGGHGGRASLLMADLSSVLIYELFNMKPFRYSYVHLVSCHGGVESPLAIAGDHFVDLVAHDGELYAATRCVCSIAGFLERIPRYYPSEPYDHFWSEP